MNSEYQEFWKILATHLLRYPLFEIQDLYKLIYQASMGSEHAGAEVDSVSARMDEEVKSLDQDSTSPLYEIISPDSRIIRIHLRPFQNNNSALDAIKESFIQTALLYKGSIANLRRYWFYAGQLSGEGRLPFKPFQLRSFFAKQEDSQFPPVHHSNRYRNSYRPSYRVVARAFLPASIASDVLSLPDK